MPNRHSGTGLAWEGDKEPLITYLYDHAHFRNEGGTPSHISDRSDLPVCFVGLHN